MPHRKLSILLMALFACSVHAGRGERQYQLLFSDWMHQHQRFYHPDDFFSRYNTWKENMQFIEEWNKGNHTSTCAMNHLGDLHIEEVRRMYNGVASAKLQLAHQETLLTSPNNIFKPFMDLKVPDRKDWREEGAVTTPKDQGQCGSCWSFSTTGAVEGCHAIRYKKLVGLSEQNLMDCSFNYGNEGCNGGLMTQAMQYIIKNNGVDTEESYPYTAKDGTTCKYKPENIGATLTGYKNIKSGNEQDLVQALNVGPVSVAIDASLRSFAFYSGGVYSDTACSSTELDHGVLAVGYATDAKLGDYYIVKNSWGANWGASGYILMSRNKKNQCGIATAATLPIC